MFVYDVFALGVTELVPSVSEQPCPSSNSRSSVLLRSATASIKQGNTSLGREVAETYLSRLVVPFRKRCAFVSGDKWEMNDGKLACFHLN